MASKYKCYGCTAVVGKDRLALECMCDDGDDQPMHGVCRKCDNAGVDIVLPQGHLLSRIHVFSVESDQFFKHLHESHIGSLTFTDDGLLKVGYWEGPNGERTIEEMEQNGVSEEDQRIAVETAKYKVFTDITRTKFLALGQCV